MTTTIPAAPDLATAPLIIEPVLEWCSDCSLAGDPEDEGLPREIVSSDIEILSVTPSEWDTSWGSLPGYEVLTLSCGHTLSLPL